LLGSNNEKKRKELKSTLDALQLDILIPTEVGNFPVPVENGKTFEENARIKAYHYNRLTGLPTLADDSGLEVDALEGIPGVHSSRYAGDSASDRDNLTKLLTALKGVPDARRTARFVCCIVLAHEESDLGCAIGVCEGTILNEMRGNQGFGYDPIFLYPPEGKTFAEIPPSLKNKISHRAKAIEKIMPILQRLYPSPP
jgi:XTP/dITP diphosphohydrolase